MHTLYAMLVFCCWVIRKTSNRNDPSRPQLIDCWVTNEKTVQKRAWFHWLKRLLSICISTNHQSCDRCTYKPRDLISKGVLGCVHSRRSQRTMTVGEKKWIVTQLFLQVFLQKRSTDKRLHKRKRETPCGAHSERQNHLHNQNNATVPKQAPLEERYDCVLVTL